MADVAIRFPPPWLPLWGSCHEVTERVNIALSAPTGHLSHRERQVALIRLALAGDARATFPVGEGFGERIVLVRNEMRTPLHECGSPAGLKSQTGGVLTGQG